MLVCKIGYEAREIRELVDSWRTDTVIRSISHNPDIRNVSRYGPSICAVLVMFSRPEIILEWRFVERMIE